MKEPLGHCIDAKLNAGQLEQVKSKADLLMCKSAPPYELSDRLEKCEALLLPDILFLDESLRSDPQSWPKSNYEYAEPEILCVQE